MPVLTAGNTVYPSHVAKVLISIPDALLRRVDEAAGRAGESRSGFLQRIAEREIDESNERLRKQLEAMLDSHPVDLGGKTAAELVREGRDSR
jgi:HicB_like antitoxin of bacterial toxin-antitoxin system